MARDGQSQREFPLGHIRNPVPLADGYASDGSDDGLLSMSAGDFYALVDRDIRNQVSPAEAAALRADRVVVERWHAVLSGMKRSVEGTLAAKRAESKAMRIDALQAGDHRGALRLSGEYNKWKMGALRFATGVSEKYAEAKYIRMSFMDDQTDVVRERYETLVDAVIEHRRQVFDGGRPVTESDLQLWDLVDR